MAALVGVLVVSSVGVASFGTGEGAVGSGKKGVVEVDRMKVAVLVVLDDLLDDEERVLLVEDLLVDDLEVVTLLEDLLLLDVLLVLLVEEVLTQLNKTGVNSCKSWELRLMRALTHRY